MSNTKKLFKNINEASVKINDYFDKNPELSKNIPEIKFVIYNNIAYPIIYQISYFYYLGGQQLYIVLKSKCIIKSTDKVDYYEVIATEQDITMGKSPIIPYGCPKDKHNSLPKNIDKLEINLK